MSLLTWIGSLRFAPRLRRHRPYENQNVHGRPARRVLIAERLEERSLLAYDIIDLGAIDVVAINSSEQVAANVGGHAALWQSGAVTDLGTLGGLSSRANDVNDAGQVVGYADTAGGQRHAFLVTPEDTDNSGTPDRWFRDDDQNGINDLMLDLGTLGGPNSEARAINNVGQVVGRSDLDAAFGSYRAFLWDSAAGMQNLGTFGVSASEASAINDCGQVVGTASLYSVFPSRPTPQGFLWDAGSGGTLLAPIYSTPRQATGINDAGQIVGNSGYTNSGCTLCPVYYYATDAFQWQNGATTALGFTSPGQAELDVSINRHAQVVGLGYLWLDDVRTDLNAAIDPSLGWGNLTALDINDAAQIVGRGTREGVPTSFLLKHGTPSLPPSISISNVAVPEGAVNAVFQVNLSRAIDQPVTVDFNTADGSATAGSDYLVASGTLTFAPGQIGKTITVSVVGDTRIEDREAFFVNLSNATAAAIADAQALGTINNDDFPPSVSIHDVTVVEGNSGTTYADFTVTLSAASDMTVTVRYATANGSATVKTKDYVATSGTLTFAPDETVKTIRVAVKGDTKDETDEYFVVNLFSASGATLFDGQATATIQDDDVSSSLLTLLAADTTAGSRKSSRR